MKKQEGSYSSGISELDSHRLLTNIKDSIDAHFRFHKHCTDIIISLNSIFHI